MTTTIPKTRRALRHEASRRLMDARERLKAQGQDLLDGAQGQGREAVENARGWIAKNPGAAVGAAFVAGALFSFMRRRRD